MLSGNCNLFLLQAHQQQPSLKEHFIAHIDGFILEMSSLLSTYIYFWSNLDSNHMYSIKMSHF